jgi:hypothetical protein
LTHTKQQLKPNAPSGKAKSEQTDGGSIPQVILVGMTLHGNAIRMSMKLEHSPTTILLSPGNLETTLLVRIRSAAYVSRLSQNRSSSSQLIIRSKQNGQPFPPETILAGLSW